MNSLPGLIGNGSTAAAISARGSVEWLCFPDFDSPSHFSGILDDRSGGRFSIRPVGEFESKQNYLGLTAVLETIFKTSTGVGRILDWMPWGQAPALIRQVETLEGVVQWELFCLPRFHYSEHPGTPERISKGICFRSSERTEQGRLIAEGPIQLDSMLGAAMSRFDLRASESRRFGWFFGRGHLELSEYTAVQACQEWEAWIHQCSTQISSCSTNPLWHLCSVRSEIHLRLLTYSRSGAMIESPTTSVPWIRRGTQNWDHRYSWLRHIPDSISAWLESGHKMEAQNLWRWLCDLILSTPAPDLLPAYSLDGSQVPEEHEIHGLRGHEGARPVRIGNLAARQFQLDSFGACLQAADLISTHFPFPSHDPIWSKLEEITLLISQLWRRPDQGIWDLRLRPEHYLSSKLSCWKGLHSATSLFQRHGRQVSARWKKEMNSLRSLILQEGFNPARQRYTLAFGENELDSSVLLIGLWGLHDWSDPEMVSTLILIESELRQGFWIRRGKGGPNHGDTDGGHTLSTLWWISALTATGRIDEASEALTELCRQAMPLGYLPEGFSVDTGRPLGNFPSARAQAVWIDTIARVERALRARESGAPAAAQRIAS